MGPAFNESGAFIVGLMPASACAHTDQVKRRYTFYHTTVSGAGQPVPSDSGMVFHLQGGGRGGHHWKPGLNPARRCVDGQLSGTLVLTPLGNAILTGSKAYDFGNLTAGAIEITIVTANGAALGDVAEISTGVSAGGIILNAKGRFRTWSWCWRPTRPVRPSTWHPPS